MKISVIVPVYNVEAYLSEAIESVMGQTYDQWELLLIDDGSTDESGAICDQYCGKEPRRIRVIHTENHGLLTARLTGIGEATGDVLVAMDSDDTLRTDALEKIAECFRETACDMVIYNAGNCPDFAVAPISHAFQENRLFDKTSMGEVYKGLVRGDIPNSVCVKATRASCIRIPDHFHGLKVINGEDLLLSTCFLAGCHRVMCINEGLYHYRIRQGSIVHTFNANRKDSVKFVHAELAGYIDRWGMPELKPLHNARKVRGWVENVKQLLKYGHSMDRQSVKKELISMAEDPYFRDSYENMEPSELSRADRVVARCLYRKRFFVLHTLYGLKKMVDAVH